METSTIIWVVVAIVVVGAVVALLASRSGKRRVESQRAKAAEIREEVQEHDRELREREAAAAEARGRAEMARAEAQKRELEAERLAAEAGSRLDDVDAVRRERDEKLRMADRRDPDVRTDADGVRLDESGRRTGDDDVVRADPSRGPGAADRS
jgi:uncharacterized membrane-anchored protein YhcB (DUF1043 family)